MCTVTVHRTSESIRVTMNRDESRARAPEIPPELRYAADRSIAWLAPTDSERGGTWMGVNAHGVVACLLNAYRPETNTQIGPRRSRGEIVPTLLACGDFEAARHTAVHVVNHTSYPSFTALLACPDAVTTVAMRNGELHARECEEEWSMFTSSSWNTEDVEAWRARAFREWRQDGAPFAGHLPTFHLLQPSGESEWSPLMDREKTCTRSITQVQIDRNAQAAVLRYWSREGLTKSPVESAIRLDENAVAQLKG